MFLLNLSALFLALQAVSARPYDRRTASGLTLVMHDTRADVYHVYGRDGSLYGRFNEDGFKREMEYDALQRRGGASSCTPMTLEQAEKIPGWGKIKQYATDKYGGGGVNIVVNPPEASLQRRSWRIDADNASQYTNSPAIICAANEIVQVEMTGQIKETDTDASLSSKQGYSNSGSWTVTETSSLAQSIGFSVQIGIPEVADISASSTTTVTIENSLASSFISSINNEVQQTITLKSTKGQKCTASLETKACTITGQGKVRFVASGWVWFNYEDKRAPVNGDPNDVHYKWAVNIENALPNIDDRSSFLDFSGSMKTTSDSVYSGECTVVGK
ncbi:hypothetical protein NLJ89_g9282 [Agrocybe chaxingu]|uniref:Uncharacterized protein n=1 Tax=Agrocybe chaxingu TaxID=84603 RepID=A0A9W8K095_9AGAR|nr:hypothetical protein NLJ89_g9282 [Agrocybe chaxingu]